MLLAEVEPNDVVFNTLMSMHASGRSLEAERVLQAMVRTGLAPDVRSFGALVKAASRRLELQRARQWLRRAEQLVDARSFYALLSCCAQLGDVQEAHGVLESMKQKGYEEDAVTKTALLRAYGTSGDTLGAEEVLQGMLSERNDGPNEYTLNAMMAACGGDVFRAERWFLELSKRGVATPIEAFNGLLANLTSDASRLQAWMDRMSCVGLAPDTISLNTLLNSCAIVCDVELAGATWRRIATPIEGSYRAYAKALARQGRVQELRELLKRSRRDVFVVRALLTACARDGGRAAAQVAEQVLEEYGRLGATCRPCFLGGLGP